MVELRIRRLSGAQTGSQCYVRLAAFQRIAPSSAVVDGATYLYENDDIPNALTGIIDHAGVRYATFEFDQAGHAISSKHAGNVDQTTIAYSVNGLHLYRTVTNALGKVTKYTFKRIGTYTSEALLQSVEGQPSTNCVAPARSLAYTSNRITTSTDEAGVQTRYTYGSDSVTELSAVLRRASGRAVFSSPGADDIHGQSTLSQLLTSQVDFSSHA